MYVCNVCIYQSEEPMELIVYARNFIMRNCVLNSFHLVKAVMFQMGYKGCFIANCT